MNCSQLNEIDGLQFMPIKTNKAPIYTEWQITKKKYDLSNCEAVGLVCGEISGNIEACDIDLKYDLTGNLFKEYKKAINSVDKTLLPKLVVQKTVSNGYHFIYRCEYIDGNKKLAQRYATAEESEKGEKVKVLLETRGEKGYIAVAPTHGYELVHGTFENIQTITVEQRNILFNVAYSFNEVIKEFVPAERIPKKQIKGLSPPEDYNDRGDVVGLLCKHGWKEVGTKGRKVLMQRPGDTKADHSGNYDTEKKWFSVFSTSTEFEAQKAYQPYAVYAVLECGGDFTKLPIKLYEDGFGDRLETTIENNISVPSKIDLTDDDYSFLATPADYDNYLDQWRKGTFEMGKSTGIPELDKYFRFKEGNLVIVNGIDNVGKSTVIWYLSMLSSMLHGWKWLIFSSENSVGSVIRKMIEFYWGEPIATMNETKYKIGKKYVEDNFDFIKVANDLYNYTDWINMMTKCLKKKKYHGAMGDPYNSFKIDNPTKTKNSTYEYHYEAASKLQLFGKNNNLSIWLNVHVGTTGARNTNPQGFTVAPQKQDTEMGVMFANKADDFLTIHRITQHETEWMMTEIHVRKIKETETGGRVTSRDKPVKLKMVNGLSGFQHFDYNPVHEWHKKENPTIELFTPKPTVKHREPLATPKVKEEDYAQLSDEEAPF